MDSYGEFLKEVISESDDKKAGLPAEASAKAGAMEVFELVLNSENIDTKAELASAGARLNKHVLTTKPRHKAVILKKPDPEENYRKIILKIKEPMPRAKLMGLGYDTAGENKSFTKSKEFSQEFYNWADNLKSNVSTPLSGKEKFSSGSGARLAAIAVTVLAGILAMVYLGFGRSGFNIKNNVIEEGNAGVKDLRSAGENLKSFNFKDASNNFKEAYDNFSKAGETLNFMGTNISNIIAGLPGAGKLRSAKNIIEVGKLLADTGQQLSGAVSAVSKTGLILNPLAAASESNGGVQNIIGLIENASLTSQNNIRKVKSLLADIDEGIIPDDKKQGFEDLKSKLPLFEKLVDDAVHYSGFLESFVGADKPKKYLLLFQNTSELRPTGGFPGTYGVVTFENGKLKDFFVDDIYNIDGQLKRNFIPPKPLQHITPTWGMRNANWFIDFPTSARKTEGFYKEEAGYDVDGVITVSPKIISKFLEIIGPVEVPGYDLSIDGDNFLTSIQSEVEYGKNRKEPKQVVMDMAPRLLEKLYSAKPGKWLEVFNTITAGLEQKDILMYFNDLYLENFAVERGFGGEVKNFDGDYLMVNISNVKGSKTDAVTDNSVKVKTTFKGGGTRHKLEITRKHNGGSSKYGFYNKVNPAYVRVLVPKNSELINITGNDSSDFKPILDYTSYRFEKDDQLVHFESSAHLGPGNAGIYREGEMTEFGFWMITEPGKEKVVELEYQVPLSPGDDYKLYVQKQPGLTVNNFQFSIYGMDNREVEGSNPRLNQVGNLYTLERKLNSDLPMEIRFK